MNKFQEFGTILLAQESSTLRRENYLLMQELKIFLNEESTILRQK